MSDKQAHVVRHESQTWQATIIYPLHPNWPHSPWLCEGLQQPWETKNLPLYFLTITSSHDSSLPQILTPNSSSPPLQNDQGLIDQNQLDDRRLKTRSADKQAPQSPSQHSLYPYLSLQCANAQHSLSMWPHNAKLFMHWNDFMAKALMRWLHPPKKKLHSATPWYSADITVHNSCQTRPLSTQMHSGPVNRRVLS